MGWLGNSADLSLAQLIRARPTHESAVSWWVRGKQAQLGWLISGPYSMSCSHRLAWAHWPSGSAGLQGVDSNMQGFLALAWNQHGISPTTFYWLTQVRASPQANSGKWDFISWGVTKSLKKGIKRWRMCTISAIYHKSKELISLLWPKSQNKPN